MSDLIERKAAITIPVMPKEHRHYQTNNLDDAYDQGWFDLQNCIEQLPPAQPERKTGRWINIDHVKRDLGATCFARRAENGELIALGSLELYAKMEVENEC